MASNDDVSLERLQQHIDAMFANRMAASQTDGESEHLAERQNVIDAMQDGDEKSAALALWFADVHLLAERKSMIQVEHYQLLEERERLEPFIAIHCDSLYFPD